MKVKALRCFRDLNAGVFRHTGDEFDISDERFNEISDKLPGYVGACVSQSSIDHDICIDESNTIAEIRAYASFHDIDLGEARKKSEMLEIINSQNK